MIRLLTSDKIIPEKWDFCINNSFAPLIYAQSWYLDQMTEKWMALILDDYTAVFPLCYKKRWGFVRINQPNFVQQLGLFTNLQLNASFIFDFLSQIPIGFFKSYINLNFSNTVFLKNIKHNVRNNYVLDLELPYLEIKKKYTENHVRNCKKAIKNNCQVILDELKISECISFYKNNIKKEIKDVKNNDWTNFESVFQKAQLLNYCKILEIKKDNATVCVGMFFVFRNRITYALGCANGLGKSIGANHFMIDFMINTFATQNFVLDFEGSQIDSLARFYSGFGAANEPYGQIVLSKNGATQ